MEEPAGITSKYWREGIFEIHENPYDYEQQKLFVAEAKKMLDDASQSLSRFQLAFKLEDRSLKKCLWMLYLDALDTLRDCFDLLTQKKHRLVGKMFRDVIELVDLAELVRNNPNIYLVKWYNDEIIPHKDYREWLGKQDGESAKKQSVEFYKELSGWTHHTYFTLKNSYSLGANNELFYDGIWKEFVSPQTISEYLWLLRVIVRRFFGSLFVSGLLSQDEIRAHPLWIILD